MSYLSCSRNGRKTEQLLDSRACLACACPLYIRKSCKDFKSLTQDQINNDLDWLAAYNHRPHNFAVRILKLDMEEIKEDEELNHVPMQVVRQRTEHTGSSREADRTEGHVRGAMLTV